MPMLTMRIPAPNPSPANAAFSLDDLVAWYRRLAELLAEIKDTTS